MSEISLAGPWESRLRLAFQPAPALFLLSLDSARAPALHPCHSSSPGLGRGGHHSLGISPREGEGATVLGFYG